MKSKQVIAGLLFLTILVGTAIWLLLGFIGLWSEADRSVQAAIIAATVALFTVTFTFWKERGRSIREAHRDKKIEVYSKFYDVMFSLMKESKSGNLRDIENDKNLQDDLFEISRGILFYGSPAVVKSFSNFKSESNRPPLEVMKAVGRILLAMRNDIGLSNFGLDELSIHQIYVADDVRNIGQDK